MLTKSGSVESAAYFEDKFKLCENEVFTTELQSLPGNLGQISIKYEVVIICEKYRDLRSRV